MSWQTISAIQVTDIWQFTAPTQGSLFRLKHSLLGTAHSFISGWVCQANFTDDDKVQIYQPQKIFPESEFTILEFLLPACFSERRIAVKKHSSKERNNLVWVVEIDMFYSSQMKQQATNAIPAAEINVSSTQKSTILNEKADGTRNSFLIINTGSSTIYCKYVPIGTDLTAANNGITVSSTVYDFTLAGGERFIDQSASQNAIVGICSGLLATTKLKVTEYIYS